MLPLLKNVWPLLLGIFLLMLGNGMQGTLLGIRGAMEGFSAGEMSLVMSGYFLGFLISSRSTPALIRRVGHVRVFAAMASIISAVFILYPAIPDVWAWGVMRVLVGACFAAVYVVAESWLNDGATNETRGQALSVYMMMQLLGVVAAQAALNLADPGGWLLFVAISVAVSLSFAPILLTVSPAPMHAATKPMELRALYRASPLGVVGTVFLGAVFSAVFGMSSVYGTEIGLSVAQISGFVSAIYLGGLAAQFPIGWLSDRIDRRKVIFAAAVLGAISCVLGWLTGGELWPLMAAAFFAGGVTTPLYALFLAYTNDNLSVEDMPAASGGLVLCFGFGAILGPLGCGWAMQALGPAAFWGVLGGTFATIGIYAVYRMTQRPPIPATETESYLGVLPTASAVTVEAAGTWAAEQAETEEAS